MANSDQQVRRGRKIDFSPQDKLLECVINIEEIFQPDGKLQGKNHRVWKVICQALSNKKIQKNQ